ncbi:MAG TPA: protein kinase [Candidatus Eisenbacteria bacterium]|nr:protein kinase [Candidatus Eisenbacteria bacterium]
MAPQDDTPSPDPAAPPPGPPSESSLENDATIGIEKVRSGTSLGTSGPIPSAATVGQLPATIGHYRILAKLGEGGMGIVYEAEQQNPRRRVALKVVRGGRLVDESMIRMFRREAETLARLRHPNIGAIYESGHTEDGQHYFAMELVLGDTLDHFLAGRPQTMTPDELRFRLSLFRRIAEAVHYAHQRGVIHRDLKPSNIIVSREVGSDPSVSTLAGVRLPDVKILDFGLARITDGDVQATQVTEVGVLKGTLSYMAPEQARGNVDAIDVRTDVYALGVILYEMLSGAKPYELTRGSLIEAVRVICEEPPRSLRSTISGSRRLSPDLETIVGKALEKEPDRRYSSAAALAEDVERYLSSQPILARPPSTIYQIQKFAARNRGLVAGIAAAFVVLIAGVVVSSLLALRATRAETLARQELARARLAEAVALAQRHVAEDARALSDVRRAEADSQRTVADQERIVAAEQRQAAVLSGAQAQLEAAKASAINRFLQDMLSTADPWAGDAGKVTLDAALEQAQKRLGSWAASDPDVDCAIRGTLATAFAGVGRYTEAESLLRGGLDRVAIAGDSLPALVASLHRQIGSILMQTSQYDRAEREFRAALASQTLGGGRASDTTALITSQVASALAYQGRFALADSMDRRAAGMVRLDAAATGLAPPEILRTRAYIDANWREDYAAADASLGTAVAQLAARTDDRTVEVSDALEERAGNRVRMDDLAGADSLYHEAVAMRRKLLGADHPLVARALENQGDFLYRTGRTDQTIQVLRQVLAIRQRGAGPESAPVGRTWVSLGPVYASARRYRDAEVAFETGIKILEKRLGKRHADVGQALKAYADFRAQQGRMDDAERLSRQALAILTDTVGPAAASTVATEVRLAGILLARRTWGLYHEAEALLLQAHTAGVDARGPGDVGSRNAAQGLVKLYDAWGKPDESRKWRAVLAAAQGGASMETPAH